MTERVLYTMIVLDGEWFQMRIPERDQYARFTKYLMEHHMLETYLKFAHPVFTHGSSLNFPASLISYSTDIVSDIGQVVKVRNQYIFDDGVDNKPRAFFHPCLMPVGDRKNAKLFPLNEDSVPTGSIVYGGTLYQRDTPVQTPYVDLDGVDSKLAVVDGELSDKKLGYVSFEGMLWSIEPLLFTNVTGLSRTWQWSLVEFTKSKTDN